ncbi:3-phosphoshikimate 1-carboxyvinyltransferase [Alphaproteobacteria bacterium]|nr:3-phosphoshikimate 1-carboxyvinyltransferase [Alphaproteobacteria bacterium]
MTRCNSSKAVSLRGNIFIPGDKSISHRSLIIASLAIGPSTISGILESEDVINTANALKSLGIRIESQNKNWIVHGSGVGGLTEPKKCIDCGNSGTSARLIIGLTTPYNFNTLISGDNSLSERPMDRVILPMKKMGASFSYRENQKLPITVHGTKDPMPINYLLPQASAQVKSAILIAGLHAPGKTSVIEPSPSRNHTEIMLKNFGATILCEKDEKGKKITIEGQTELKPSILSIPGDFSSAAFFIVATLITPNSEIKLTNIGTNPLRTGLIKTLNEMGAKIELTNPRTKGGEKISDIKVRSAKLKGVKIPASRAASMIDEYPILCVAAAFAKGITFMDGLDELKVKESNRIITISKMLKSLGVDVTETTNSIHIKGKNGSLEPKTIIQTKNDHRIAMSALVAGMGSSSRVEIDEVKSINTSFPGFIELANSIGANIEIDS